MIDNVKWTFPLPRTHTGILLGNGTTGLMIWGEKNRLKITIGRADFWDHRGGMNWTPKQNYRNIRHCLENNNQMGIKKIFKTDTEGKEGFPRRPSVLPVGRIDVLLREKATLKNAQLNLKSGLAKINYKYSGKSYNIHIQLSMESQLFTVKCPITEKIKVEGIPSWNFLSSFLRSISFEEPIVLNDSGLKGWIQKCPVDPALGVGYCIDQNTIWVMNQINTDVENLKNLLKTKLANIIDDGVIKLAKKNKKWWEKYWRSIPEISIPNKTLDFIYNYGIYKFAGFTNPSGVAATLQGPWIEENKMPPWSSDYHFNINVQMCYWPAYKANKLDHLMPLFDMVWSWREKLRKNAKFFIGIDDGYMLPHAVDNTCVCMGSFWTGTVDHACTGWIAQMMFDYVKYSGDLAFLEAKAYPFMKGTMRVYEAMLEKTENGYELPVSVSPEYRGSGMDAWGKNASFQLACIHRLCEDLINASEMLGLKGEAVWSDILENLPKVTTITEDNEEVIALWEGTYLEESHRHHSHLAAICPFDSIDIYSSAWRPLISRSINHWIGKGMGQWSGWCVPWASMIHSRLGNGEIAELLLEIWERVFTNEGYGTLHDCNFSGLSLMGAPSFDFHETARDEIMQMDAGMGAIVAVQDMLMNIQRGVVKVFIGVPKSWKDVEFKNMLCEGGFLVSGIKRNYSVYSINVKSQRGGVFKITNPWPKQPVKAALKNRGSQKLTGNIIEIPTDPNDEIILQSN